MSQAVISGCVELLVEGCGRVEPVSEGECCVYGAGALRVLALEPGLRARATRHGAVHLAALHLKLLNTAVSQFRAARVRDRPLTTKVNETPRKEARKINTKYHKGVGNMTCVYFFVERAILMRKLSVWTFLSGCLVFRN